MRSPAGGPGSPATAAWAWSPPWAPDGTRLAFASARDGKAQIYIMVADGSRPTRLTQDSANDLSPACSPDGRQIAFVSDRIDDTPEVYVMDADGSAPRRLI